ncbi:MAG TPA: hypothetical protein VGL13_15270 [Polyangiaceae bacterium]
MAFAEFLKARRAARSFAHHAESLQESQADSVPEMRAEPPSKGLQVPAATPSDPGA